MQFSFLQTRHLDGHYVPQQNCASRTNPFRREWRNLNKDDAVLYHFEYLITAYNVAC